ncbi:hypothetical protein MWN41_01305 [Ornithobacterium rhinotracheale]|uniref:hypothetical protein n=1 Tax=Ornithobacterium rhinotracheale TaxID=28251 RepID=UPI001FF224C0|nr:hypothetical protein [Ornithobacterium rhinotracheale]MCK0201651.1 hypothetical protein [Ornithobacterium rhinotracheale]
MKIKKLLAYSMAIALLSVANTSCKNDDDENGVLYAKGHFFNSSFCSKPILMLTNDKIMVENKRLWGVYLKNVERTEFNFEDTYLVKFKLLYGEIKSCVDYGTITYKDAHAISIKKIEK